MTARPHKGKAVRLPGKYYKFMLEAPLEAPPIEFLVHDPEPAASRSNHREPFVLMHTSKWRKQTRVSVPLPITVLDDFRTSADAPSTGTLAAGSETTPERPESPDEVTGLIERLAAVSSDGGTGAGEGEGGAAASGGAAACAQCGIGGVELKRCVRCWQVAYCGRE